MREDARQKIEGKLDVYVCPDVFLKLNKLLNDENSTNPQISQLIETDPGLTSIILKIVNSAFYGFKQTITAVTTAINIIGRQELANIVFVTLTPKVFTQSEESKKLMKQHWDHMLLTGLIAKNFAIMCNKVSEKGETVFVSGMFHDIGKILLASEDIPINHVIQTSDDETNALGFTHADAGAFLLEHWELPEVVVEAVELHHDPEKAHHKDAVYVTYLSNILSKMEKEEEFQTLLDDKYMSEYLEDMDMEKIKGIMHISKFQLREVQALISV